MAFRYRAAGNQPDFRTIPDFRKRPLEALSRLFVRKAIVVPVFGQINGRGFRQFLLLGNRKARGEWSLICMTRIVIHLHRRLEGRGSMN